MSIEVIKAGMQTSVQDGGRPGYMHLGVAPGGAMDRLSMSLANRLLGNSPTHPLLEICISGPVLRFTQSMSIAICGAQFEMWRVNQQGKFPLARNQSVTLQAGDELHFAKRLVGARAYLALAAQIDCPKVMASLATHFQAGFGGLAGRALQTGDVVPLRDCQVRPIKILPVVYRQSYSGKYLLRCCDSVESDLFSDSQRQTFYQQTYQLSHNSNRMGLRLTGEALPELAIADMTSSGLLPGSIQVPPSGVPIIAGVDAQTIGGYPRIANIISADLFALAQLVPGDRLNFVHVNIKQAQAMLRAQQKSLAVPF